jgi:hypothetical protein
VVRRGSSLDKGRADLVSSKKRSTIVALLISRALACSRGKSGSAILLKMALHSATTLSGARRKELILKGEGL